MNNIAVLGAGKIFSEKYIYLLKWLKITRKIKGYKIFDLYDKEEFLYSTHKLNNIELSNFNNFLILLPNNLHDDYVFDICSSMSSEHIKSIIVEKPVFTSSKIYQSFENHINKIHSVNPKRAISSVIEATSYIISNKLNFNNEINIEIYDGIPIKWNASYLSTKNMLNSCLWDIGSHDFDLVGHCLGISNFSFDIVSLNVLEFSYQNYFCDFTIRVEEVDLIINFKVRLSRLKSILPRITMNFFNINSKFQIPLFPNAKFLKFDKINSCWGKVFPIYLSDDDIKFSETALFLNALNNIPSISYPLSSDVKFSVKILEKLS